MLKKIPITVEKPKGRHHKMLFAPGSPFKLKVVQRKDLYRRKPKHLKGNTYD